MPHWGAPATGTHAHLNQSFTKRMHRQSTVHQPTNTSSSPGSESSSQWHRQLFFFLFCRCDRNVKDAALSFYHYYLHWVFEPEDLTLDEFIEWFFVYENPKADAFDFNADQMRHLGKDTLAKAISSAIAFLLASWYPHRKDENVLWLHYEDLKADLKRCIKLISDFTNLGVGDTDLLDLVERQVRSYRILRSEGGTLRFLGEF